MRTNKRIEVASSGTIIVGPENAISVKRTSGLRIGDKTKWADTQQVVIGTAEVILNISKKNRLSVDLPPTVKIRIIRRKNAQ